MKTKTIPASAENLSKVFAFVEECLEEKACSRKMFLQIQMAVEEIFVNIASYAYQPESGTVKIGVEVQEEPLTAVITFLDHGIPYDPLSRESPDLDIPIEERDVGGLGIYLVKEIMDDVSYEYRDGQNMLTLTKRL